MKFHIRKPNDLTQGFEVKMQIKYKFNEKFIKSNRHFFMNSGYFYRAVVYCLKIGQISL